VAVLGSFVRWSSACRFEGAADVRPYGAQQQAWQCPVVVHFHSVKDGAAVPGMAPWWRGWLHKADGDGGDAPDVMA
jgi:hypothetical protein